MRTNQAKLTSFDYQGGKLVTDRLHEILGTKTIRELGEKLDISASTIATWHKRALCPFEIVLRAHMYTGASLKWLTLGESHFRTENLKNTNQNALRQNSCSILTHSTLSMESLRTYKLSRSISLI